MAKNKRKFFSMSISLKGLVEAFTLCSLAATALDHTIDDMIDTRPLTDNEVLDLQNTFQDAVDYDEVKIHSSNGADKLLNFLGASALANRNLIIINSSYNEDDFTQTEDPLARHILDHEMAHVWQFQGCDHSRLERLESYLVSHLSGGSEIDMYNFDLSEGDNLESFNVEAQAEIIAQYAEMKRNNFQIPSNYKYALEDFIENPNYRCEGPN
jgi:hypothetical protein